MRIDYGDLVIISDDADPVNDYSEYPEVFERLRASKAIGEVLQPGVRDGYTTASFQQDGKVYEFLFESRELEHADVDALAQLHAFSWEVVRLATINADHMDTFSEINRLLGNLLLPGKLHSTVGKIAGLVKAWLK